MCGLQSATLSFAELSTLVHEMGMSLTEGGTICSDSQFCTSSPRIFLLPTSGHALHSFMSKTTYQNVSGTRGSLDFGEVPSTLFELFLRDAEVLSAVARHSRTGEVSLESE